MHAAQPLAATKDVAHSRPSSCLRSWRAVPRAAAIVRRAPRQVRLNADQRQMAQMHADGSWVPRQRSQTQLSVRPAACGGGLRPICVHQRHPLLICVESCLLWRRLLRPPREFRKSPQYARICQVSSTEKKFLIRAGGPCGGHRTIDQHCLPRQRQGPIVNKPFFAIFGPWRTVR